MEKRYNLIGGTEMRKKEKAERVTRGRCQRKNKKTMSDKGKSKMHANSQTLKEKINKRCVDNTRDEQAPTYGHTQDAHVQQTFFSSMANEADGTRFVRELESSAASCFLRDIWEV